MDFHTYEIAWPGNGWMQIWVENVWQILEGGSFSGDKKTMK